MATLIPIPKPLEIDLALYRKHIRQVRATEEQKKTMRRALENWRRITESGQITPRRLGPIVEAAKSKYAAEWDMSTDLLGNLVHQFPEAKEAFREIARNGNAAQRWHVLSGLRYCNDRQFCQEIVEARINDKSTAVRRRAAYAADVFWLTGLVPALRQRRDVETVRNVKEILEYHIAMLTDGFLIGPGPPDERRLDLTVRVPWGWRTILIQPEEVERGRIPQIAEETRRKRF